MPRNIPGFIGQAAPGRPAGSRWIRWILQIHWIRKICRSPLRAVGESLDQESQSLESIGCIFCGGVETDAPAILEEHGYIGRQCPRCRLIFVSPRPDRNEVLNLYGHDRAQVQASTSLADTAERVLHARHLLGLLRRYKGEGALLEIGAGGGTFLGAASKAGYDVYGIELNPVLAGHIAGTRRLRCEANTLAEAYPGESFDVVVLCDVISHLSDPIRDFQLLHDRLREGGVVLFETGNLGDVDPKYYPAYPSLQYPDHLFLFGEENLHEILRRTGFELVALHRYSILAYLRFLALLCGFSGRKARGHGVDPGGASRVPDVDPDTAPPRWWRKRARWLLGVSFHLLRYRLGAVLPRLGRPQTMIVLARKLPATTSRNLA